jgi:hypothetical protein
MPKYKARITETIYKVAFAYIDADDEADAWDKADSLIYLPESEFKETDSYIEVSDIELAEKEIIHATAR